MQKSLLHLVFLASGLSSLIYEVVWVREFAAVFGGTVYSAAFVSAVFILGLGVGSLAAGRLADLRFDRQSSWPLTAYGVSELLIGLLAVLVELVVARMQPLSVAISQYVVDDFGLFELSTSSLVGRYFATFVLLAPVTFLMGGTLALLVRYVVGRELSDAGRIVGTLYGANTLGAAIGCALADTVLIPKLGISTTYRCAAALSVSAGVLALLLATVHVDASRDSTPKELDINPISARAAAWTAAALFLSGFAVMAMELVWFRHITAVLGQYRAVFSGLLAVILVGFWLGSVVAGLVGPVARSPALLFAVSQVLCSGVALASIFGLDADHSAAVAAGGHQAYAEAGPTLRLVLEYWWNLRVILAVTFVPSVLMGFSFPLANAYLQRSVRRVGTIVGFLYLATTIGNVLGSLAAGFVFLGLLGIQATVILVCALMNLSAVMMYWAAKGTAATHLPSQRFAFSGVIVGGVLVLLAFSLAPADTLVWRSFPAARGRNVQVLSVSEGINETIVVTRREGIETKLHTNGHSMSSTNISHQRYMRSFVHVPMLMMDGAASVLVICFGVGNTVHAASLYPELKRIEVADLSKHVVQHASFFSESNRDVLRDPRIRVFINDGRHHLLMQSPGTYDLVTLEPPPISFAGVSSLYSEEFYRLARSRLTNRGFVTQWLPAYQVRADVVGSMVRAFVDVFPNAILLMGESREMILVGRAEGRIEFSPDSVNRRLAGHAAVVADLKRIEIESLEDLVSMFLADSETLRTATESFPPLVDDWPVLEYSQVSNVTETSLPPGLLNVDRVRAWCPDCFTSETNAVFQIDKLNQRLELIRELVKSPEFQSYSSFVEPGRRNKIFPRSRSNLDALISESAYFSRVVPSPGAAVLRARRFVDQGLKARAIDELERATFFFPGDFEVLQLLCALDPGGTDGSPRRSACGG